MSDLNEQLRYTSDGALAECPCCGSLDVGGAHDTVHCYRCGLTITKPRPLQNAMDAWNRRTRRAPAAAPAPVAAVPKQWESQLRLCPSTEDVIAAMKAEIAAWRALAAVPAAAPIVQPVGNERAAFETHIRSTLWQWQNPEATNQINEGRGKGKYFYEHVNVAWEAWQARAAIATSADEVKGGGNG